MEKDTKFLKGGCVKRPYVTSPQEKVGGDGKENEVFFCSCRCWRLSSFFLELPLMHLMLLGVRQCCICLGESRRCRFPST